MGYTSQYAQDSLAKNGNSDDDKKKKAAVKDGMKNQPKRYKSIQDMPEKERKKAIAARKPKGHRNKKKSSF